MLGRIARARKRVRRLRARVKGISYTEYMQLHRIRVTEEKKQRAAFERYKVERKYVQRRADLRKNLRTGRGGGVIGKLGQIADNIDRNFGVEQTQRRRTTTQQKKKKKRKKRKRKKKDRGPKLHIGL